MLQKNDRSQKKGRLIIPAILIVVIIAGVFVFLNSKKSGNLDTITQHTTPDNSVPPVSNVDARDKPVTEIVRKEIEKERIIDYKDVQDQDKPLNQLMETRKESLGLHDSLDMIVRSDETFKIGDIHVSMRDILEKAFLNKGDVFVEKIDDSGRVIPQKIKEYGIYVVKPGDNIWNIHFNILKEYYHSKGIQIEPLADEPVEKGLSSGIGKILKFSETMVIIYNLVEKQIDKNINLLQPLSKIVLYNMDEVFSLLEEINYNNVDRIQFDGKSIWISAEKS